MVVALLPMFHSNLVVEYIAIVTHSGVQLRTSLGPLSGEMEREYIKTVGAFDITRDSAHVVP